MRLKSAEAWIAWRLLFSKKTLFGGSAPLALFGLILGVASLVVSMAVMSGFEKTLRDAMSDVTGHVTVGIRTTMPQDWKNLETRIRNVEPTLVSSVRFARVEAVLAHHGQISGVMIQGLDAERLPQVLRLESRLQEGTLQLQSTQDEKSAFIGQGIAKRMGLKVGDHFKVVVPIADNFDSSKFSRKMADLKVQAIVDLGKNDWNERFIMTDLKVAQELAQIGGDRFSGLLLRFQDAEYARKASFHLSQTLGPQFFVTDWREVNENLFEAVRIERVVIFFVVLIIVIVAAFNISSTLFVNVMQRFADIAILKSLGFNKKSLLQIFSLQGLFLGSFGVLIGDILGIILSFAFSLLQKSLNLISGSVYRVDAIIIDIRFVDLLIVAIATLLICLIASLAPAWRGAKLNPVEGLRYG